MHNPGPSFDATAVSVLGMDIMDLLCASRSSIQAGCLTLLQSASGSDTMSWCASSRTSTTSLAKPAACTRHMPCCSNGVAQAEHSHRSMADCSMHMLEAARMPVPHVHILLLSPQGGGQGSTTHAKLCLSTMPAC